MTTRVKRTPSSEAQMSTESAVREVYEKIFGLLDRETEKAKENGDTVYADHCDLLRAKIRSLFEAEK